MSREQNHVIDSLIAATDAPGAKPKLNQLNITPEQAKNLILHVSRLPTFAHSLNNLIDQKYAGALQPLDVERLVFLHIPKCGGTTLHNMLVDWQGENAQHPERHNNLYFYSARDLASKTLFSGHYDYYSTTLIPGPRKMITFLRDPRSRLVSLYNFHRSHREEIIERYNLSLARWANMYDIDEYFANPVVRAHPAVNNAMARYFSDQPQLGAHAGNVAAGDTPVEVLCDQAKRNLRKFDFIGLVEDYDNSIQRLAHILGQTVPEKIEKARNFKTLMETDPHMKQIEEQSATEETQRLMDDIVKQDEIVYDFAKSIYTTT